MTRDSRGRWTTLVNRHFGFEACDDVDGVMSTLAECAEHEVIPSPVGSLADPAEQRAYYELLFSSITGESVDPIRRYYGEDFVVDETLWHGTGGRRSPVPLRRQERPGELPAPPRLRDPRRQDRPRAGVVRPRGDPAPARLHRQLTATR